MYKPPPKRKIAYPITTMEMTKDDGLTLVILSNHLLSEKDVDEARFLNFFDIYRSFIGD